MTSVGTQPLCDKVAINFIAKIEGDAASAADLFLAIFSQRLETV
jgi:hypothetical protein